MINNMQVIKRNGSYENVSFDKIITRIQSIKDYLNLDRVNVIEIAQETVKGLKNNIQTSQLDIYAADKCAERIIDDPQYSYLASGICVSNLHKTTLNDILKVTELLYENSDGTRHNPLVNLDYLNFVKKYAEQLNNAIDYNRDYLLDYFSIKTLENTYLSKIYINKNKTIIERPQHMFMRVAIGIHYINDDIDKVIESYNFMSNKYFVHASPTLFNAGSTRPQLSSCFLLHMKDDIDGIFKTVSDIAKISKYAGGIGVHLQDVRASGSLIRGTNGLSKGIVPIVKILNEVAKCVNQGGKRNGAIASYIEPWHSDIFQFCELKRNTGDEELRARDSFLALWIPDLFMKRLINGEKWSLMCPDECPGLTNSVGEQFEELYVKYENEKRYKKQVDPLDLWKVILASITETGIPYIHFKDHANRLSNQQNLGVIKSSNLCGEIIEYSDENEIAVCNLASICLPTFIKNKIFDFQLLSQVAEIITVNLNNIIDINYYPVVEAKNSNFRHRPIGIGVQGLADVFCMLDIPFDSPDALIINQAISEAIYYGSLKASCELAKKYGPYSTFKGSPFSKGQFQYHLWNFKQSNFILDFDWDSLVNDIIQYGTRNSLLTTIMPTATTSQIMGFNECTEPFTTNLYTRTTLAGEYTIVNKYLIEKLVKLGIWNEDIKNKIVENNGSVQNIEEIPKNIRNMFKTAFEIQMKSLIDLAISRGPFIDQSQSMNLFIKDPDFDRLNKCLVYAWKNKLKTGLYYLRSQPAVNAIKFGLNNKDNSKKNKSYNNPIDFTENQCSSCH